MRLINNLLNGCSYLLDWYRLRYNYLLNWLLNGCRLSYYLLSLNWSCLNGRHDRLLGYYLLNDGLSWFHDLLNGLNLLNWLDLLSWLRGHNRLHWLLNWDWLLIDGHRLRVHLRLLRVNLGLYHLRNNHGLHRLWHNHRLLHNHRLGRLLIILLLRLIGDARLWLLCSGRYSFPVAVGHLLPLSSCLLHILLSLLLLKLLVSHRWNLCHQ